MKGENGKWRGRRWNSGRRKWKEVRKERNGGRRKWKEVRKERNGGGRKWKEKDAMWRQGGGGGEKVR